MEARSRMRLKYILNPFVLLFILRWGFSESLRVVLNSLCRPGRAWTWDTSASGSLERWWHSCATEPRTFAFSVTVFSWPWSSFLITIPGILWSFVATAKILSKTLNRSQKGFFMGTQAPGADKAHLTRDKTFAHHSSGGHREARAHWKLVNPLSSLHKNHSSYSTGNETWRAFPSANNQPSGTFTSNLSIVWSKWSTP